MGDAKVEAEAKAEGSKDPRKEKCLRGSKRRLSLTEGVAKRLSLTAKPRFSLHSRFSLPPIKRRAVVLKRASRVAADAIKDNIKAKLKPAADARRKRSCSRSPKRNGRSRSRSSVRDARKRSGSRDARSCSKS